MEKFQGVATKYLQHYWAWYTVTEQYKQTTNGEYLLHQAALQHRSIFEYRVVKKE